jgi:hypothetical protein
MKLVIITLLILCLSACVQPRENAELREMLSQVVGIDIGGSFKVVEFETSGALGDYAEEYRIQFSGNFNNIKNIVESSGNWEKMKGTNTFQSITTTFKSNDFNHVISRVSINEQEIWVQFISE